MVESPARELGDDISPRRQGRRPAWSPAGSPARTANRLAGASVDVWQANAEASTTCSSPASSRRATCGAVHRRRRRPVLLPVVVPRYYPIPDDGPVGELLRATGRHPYRPAHVHFIVAGARLPPLTTHIFVDGTPYLDSDAVFGVKESLIRDVAVVDDPARAAEHRLPNPFRTLTFDLALLARTRRRREPRLPLSGPADAGALRRRSR